MDRAQVVGLVVTVSLSAACGSTLPETGGSTTQTSPALSTDQHNFRECPFAERAEAMLAQVRQETEAPPIGYLFGADVRYGQDWFRVGFILTSAECGLVEFRSTQESESEAITSEQQPSLFELASNAAAAGIAQIDETGPLGPLAHLPIEERPELQGVTAVQGLDEAVVVDLDGPTLLAPQPDGRILITPLPAAP